MTTWNTEDKGSAIVLSEGNLKAAGIYQTSSVKSTDSKSMGKWFCEIKIDKNDFSCVGIGLPDLLMTKAITASTQFFAYHQNGSKQNGTASSYGAGYDTGDVIGILVDFDIGELTFYKNGVSQGVAFNNIKSLNSFCIIASSGTSIGDGRVIANFGATPFLFAPDKSTLPKGVKSFDGSQILSSVDKTLVLSNGEYKKFNKGYEGQKDIGNLVPKMTSNTSPSGRVSSAVYNADAWKAFNGDLNSGWNSYATSPGLDWLQYEFLDPVAVTKIILRTGMLSSNQAGLRNFKIFGSNDNSKFDLIFQATHENNTNDQIYTFENTEKYKTYRISADSYYAGELRIFISKWEMYQSEIERVFPNWSTVSITPPTSTQFLEEGMDNLPLLFDRVVKELEPITTVDKSDMLNDTGKMFSSTIDLKKNLDIRGIRFEVK